MLYGGGIPAEPRSQIIEPSLPYQPLLISVFMSVWAGIKFRGSTASLNGVEKEKERVRWLASLNQCGSCGLLYIPNTASDTDDRIFIQSGKISSSKRQKIIFSVGRRVSKQSTLKPELKRKFHCSWIICDVNVAIAVSPVQGGCQENKRQSGIIGCKSGPL